MCFFFLISLNPRFSMPFQSRASSVVRLRFRESGAAVADDVYSGTKRNGTSVSSLYLLEKMENKTNRSNEYLKLGLNRPSFVSESFLFRQ